MRESMQPWLYVHMSVNGKMRPVETISEMGGSRGDKGE
jgi:hypothetical protein